jgi:hypothetical protein
LLNSKNKGFLMNNKVDFEIVEAIVNSVRGNVNLVMDEKSQLALPTRKVNETIEFYDKKGNNPAVSSDVEFTLLSREYLATTELGDVSLNKISVYDRNFKELTTFKKIKVTEPFDLRAVKPLINEGLFKEVYQDLSEFSYIKKLLQT